MHIHIEKPGNNTLTGNALLKIIQNGSMAWIDLLVREAIQNSLDAVRDGEKYVDVDFSSGTFSTQSLAPFLPHIDQQLLEKFEGQQTYLSIRDKNTEGLTGPLTHDELGNDVDEGNLISLVYDIMKAQTKEGAGGSWGLGKTAYYRVGVGLVIYYSRIKQDSGVFEERLAINMVEDEQSENSIIPGYKGHKKMGIAWWGEFAGENKTKPLTKSEKIGEILKVFGLEGYKNQDTGTQIIIPFLDVEQLLSTNLKGVTSEETRPYFTKSIELYIKTSIQRWYAPRLNNRSYKYGPYLTASVNNKPIKDDDLYPFFKVVKDLYNVAILKEKAITNYKYNYMYENVNLNNIFKGDNLAGRVAFVKVTAKELGERPPYNNLNMYALTNSYPPEKEGNPPIIMYTRRPGMIVSYETFGEWVKRIDNTGGDEYVIGFFVLNSDNELKDEHVEKGAPRKLEEYIRLNEGADHTGWSDKSYLDFNPEISNKIKGHVSSKVSNKVNKAEEVVVLDKNSILSRSIGKMILPSTNFGCVPRARNESKNVNKVKSVNNKFMIMEDEIFYEPKGIVVPFELDIVKPITIMSLYLAVSTESSSVSVDTFEQTTNNKLPFELNYIDLYINDENIILRKGFINIETGQMSIEELISEAGITYGVKISAVEIKKSNISGDLSINTYVKNVMPTVIYKEEKKGDING